MPTNTAAWLNEKHGRFQIGEAPYTSPSADQIVIRNRAVAMNPLEWIIQVEGNLFYGWLDYPTVLGSDTAGEVVEVGSGVTRFKVGDRVLGHAVGTDKDTKSAAEGTFQEYTLVLERLAAPLPETLSFEEAATLPLAVSTASCALFEAAWLGLQLPSANPTPTGQTVLVWGGSTSVGSQAIQLAMRRAMRSSRPPRPATSSPSPNSARHSSSTTTAPPSRRTSSPPCPAGPSPAPCRSARREPPLASGSPVHPKATVSSRSAHRRSRSNHWPRAASAPASGSPRS